MRAVPAEAVVARERQRIGNAVHVHVPIGVVRVVDGDGPVIEVVGVDDIGALVPVVVARGDENRRIRTGDVDHIDAMELVTPRRRWGCNPDDRFLLQAIDLTVAQTDPVFGAVDEGEVGARLGHEFGAELAVERVAVEVELLIVEVGPLGHHDPPVAATRDLPGRDGRVGVGGAIAGIELPRLRAEVDDRFGRVAVHLPGLVDRVFRAADEREAKAAEAAVTFGPQGLPECVVGVVEVFAMGVGPAHRERVQAAAAVHAAVLGTAEQHTAVVASDHRSARAEVTRGLALEGDGRRAAGAELVPGAVAVPQHPAGQALDSLRVLGVDHEIVGVMRACEWVQVEGHVQVVDRLLDVEDGLAGARCAEGDDGLAAIDDLVVGVHLLCQRGAVFVDRSPPGVARCGSERECNRRERRNARDAMSCLHSPFNLR